MHVRRSTYAKAYKILPTAAGTAFLLWTIQAYTDSGRNLLTDYFETPRPEQPLREPGKGRLCTQECRAVTQVKGNRKGDAFLAYTAYYDKNTESIGIVSSSGVQPYDKVYYCLIWEENDNETQCLTVAKLESIISTQRNAHHGILTKHRCRIQNSLNEVRVRVVITESEACQDPAGERSLQVHNVPPAPARSRVQFAVCCLPEWDPGDSEEIEPENLMSFFETNALFGAQKFYFYNMSTTRRHEQILKYYQDAGLLTIIQWPKHVDALSFAAARQDCLQRSKSEAQYVVYLTVHDILAPSSGDSWRDIVRQAGKSSPPAYRFADVLFGVPSLSHCPLRNSSLVTTAARMRSVQHTLFSQFAVSPPTARFYRTMYILDNARSHPSVDPNDWAAASIDDNPVVRVSAVVATVRNYGGQPRVSPTDRGVRVQPLKYDPRLCRHADAVAGQVRQTLVAAALAEAVDGG